MWDFLVPIDLVEANLPAEARFLYIYLLSKASPKTKVVRSNHTRLAQELHMHRATVCQLVTALVQSGWVKVQPDGRYHRVYALLNPVLEARLDELRRVQDRIAHADYKGEAIMHEILNQKVASDRYDVNARLGFTRNPVTDRCLEVDRYYFEEKVGFEFNGPQHYGPTEAFPNPEKARDLRARDYIKRAMCQEHGIHLITITAEDLTPEKIEHKIRGLLPLRPLRPDDPVLRYLRQVGLEYMRRAGKPARSADK